MTITTAGIEFRLPGSGRFTRQALSWPQVDKFVARPSVAESWPMWRYELAVHGHQSRRTIPLPLGGDPTEDMAVVWAGRVNDALNLPRS